MMQLLNWLCIVLFYLLSLLPLTILYILSDLSYLILFYLVGYRKNIVMNNLKSSFPDKKAKELQHVQRVFINISVIWSLNLSKT
jgi:KDO2-lipid IV(A) lauroyltransferase